MEHLILTGASRGIGRAFALAWAGPHKKLTLLARDAARLAEVEALAVSRGALVDTVVCDFADVDAAAAAGVRVAERSPRAGAVVVHNAGIWPSAKALTAAFGRQLEMGFVVNHLAPLAFQRGLLRRGVVNQVVVVSAGLIAAGKFRAAKTPEGADFSSLKTYSNTKLAAAVMARALAVAHPDIDVTALHPGVVQTALGDRGGLVGALLRFVKKKWEHPDVTAARLVRVLQRPRGTAGVAQWLFREEPQPWPTAVDAAEADVVAATRALMGDPFR